MNEWLTANKVMQYLDISITTLNNWYKWYNDTAIEKPKDVPELPPYFQTSLKAKRLWRAQDLKLLKKFQHWVPKGRAGLMGKVTGKYNDKEKIKEKNKLAYQKRKQSLQNQ